MASAVMAGSSAGRLSTQLCPIDAFGSLPTCLSVTEKSVQDAGTSIDLVLYCIASFASTVTAQSAAKTGPAQSASNGARYHLDMCNLLEGRVSDVNAAMIGACTRRCNQQNVAACAAMQPRFIVAQRSKMRSPGARQRE